MPEKYEKDMNVLMKAAAEVKVSSKKLKRYTSINYAVLDTNHLYLHCIIWFTSVYDLVKRIENIDHVNSRLYLQYVLCLEGL